jgi:predicted nucleotidyltransferase component of viral defense system
MNPGKKRQNLEKILIQLLDNQVLPEECYLAGGTALYYYLHHRLSIDLDFFVPKPFNSEALVFNMRERFKEVDLELMEKDTLILFLSAKKMKFSLFYLPYPLLSPLTPYKIRSGTICPLASLEDIEAMKAISLVQRGSAKDFVDLYYLVKQTKHSFEDIALHVRRKYKVDEKYTYHLKTAMIYFDDAEKEVNGIVLINRAGRIRTISKNEWKEIKAFFVRFCR